MGRRSPTVPVSSMWITAEPTLNLPQSPAEPSSASADATPGNPRAISAAERIELKIRWKLIRFLPYADTAAALPSNADAKHEYLKRQPLTLDERLAEWWWWWWWKRE